MRTVFIAGATGYLGGHLCTAYRGRGWRVHALVRDRLRAETLDADRLIEAHATMPATLAGTMADVDLVVSALGITRQKDRLDYRDVDYRANLNLLQEAQRAKVPHFGYVHVLNAEAMAHVPLVAAKRAFVRDLQQAAIRSTVIAPSGYFSDMEAFFDGARSGRVWLFGTGSHRLNPIDGADLAAAIAEATETGRDWLDIGGPDVLTQDTLARMAFDALGHPARITYLPDWLRRAGLALLPRVTPRRIHGPAQFFLTALAQDMVGPPCGTRHLAEHFSALAGRRADRRAP